MRIFAVWSFRDPRLADPVVDRINPAGGYLAEQLTISVIAHHRPIGTRCGYALAEMPGLLAIGKDRRARVITWGLLSVDLVHNTGSFCGLGADLNSPVASRNRHEYST